MKKVFALLMALVLIVPAAALADALLEDGEVVDLSFALLPLGPNDFAQVGEKAEGSVLAIIYPDYDDSSIFHNNISVAWTADLSVSEADDVNAVLEAVVAEIMNGLNAQGIAVSNPVYLLAEQDAETGVLSLFYAMDVDYTGLGVDLITSLYQMQIYMPVEDDGTYVFTLSADSPEGIEALGTVLERFEFNE